MVNKRAAAEEANQFIGSVVSLQFSSRLKFNKVSCGRSLPVIQCRRAFRQITH